MRRGVSVAVKVGVSLALLAYLLSTTDLAALTRRVRSGDPLLFAGALALYTLTMALATWRWRLLLRAQGYQAPIGH